MDYHAVPSEQLVWGSSTVYSVVSNSVKQIYNLYLINFLVEIQRAQTNFNTVPLLRLPRNRLSGPQTNIAFAYGNTNGTFTSAWPYGLQQTAFSDRFYLTQSIMYSVQKGYRFGAFCVMIAPPGAVWD